ncbi:MAG: tetratricopeptide repeat protein, partial [Acidobacteriota bacterium]
MGKAHHSTFNPHEIEEEALERLFVAREDLALDVMGGIRESAFSDSKHQRLLTGPRGIGKTFFVTLMYRRVRREQDLDDRLRIAWLNEDLRVHNYAGLLRSIAQKLAAEYGESALARAIDEVLDLADQGLQESALEKKILDFLGDKTLLLILENLDDLLAVLKESGQRKLRSLVETQRNVSILATSMSLAGPVMDRKKTLFGFFSITTLKPLDVEEATRLLALLAEEDKDQDLVKALRSSLGYARIRAVHYLAGGNPRVYVLLYDFLSRESLDDLTQPFRKLTNGLTPYYEARMDRLSPLQRTLVDVLSRYREPLIVTEIARQVMSSPQSVSSQLAKLRSLGYVDRVASVGRETYYELREPLMRFCLQIKEQQGRTIDLFVQFLRVWYSEPELNRLAMNGFGVEQEAARVAMRERDPLLAPLVADFSSYQAAGDHERALAAAESAIERSPRKKEHWVRKAQSLHWLDLPVHDRLSAWREVVKLDPKDSGAWWRLSWCFYDLGKIDEAAESSRRAFELSPEDPDVARVSGALLHLAGRPSEAKASLERALELSSDPASADDWGWRANDLVRLGRMDEALAAFRRSLEEDLFLEFTWNSLFFWLYNRGRPRLLHDLA